MAPFCEWLQNVVMGVLKSWAKPRIIPFYGLYFLWAFTRPMPYGFLHDPVLVVVIKTLSMWYLIFYVQIIKDLWRPNTTTNDDHFQKSNSLEENKKTQDLMNSSSTEGLHYTYSQRISNFFICLKSTVWSLTPMVFTRAGKQKLVREEIQSNGQSPEDSKGQIKYVENIDISSFAVIQRDKGNQYENLETCASGTSEEIILEDHCDKQIYLPSQRNGIDQSGVTMQSEDLSGSSNAQSDRQLADTSQAIKESNYIRIIFNRISKLKISLVLRRAFNAKKNLISVEEDDAYKQFFTLALVISSMGDAFMIFPSTFIPGVLSYGSAHVLSIVGFRSRFKRPRFSWLIYPYNGIGVVSILVWIRSLQMALIILAYAFMLTTVMFYALSNLETRPGVRSLVAAIGASFYVWSDTMIAYDKWLFDLPLRDALVWSTYFFAQMNLALSV